MKIILTIVTMLLILLTSISTVHAVNKYAECKDNGNIAPCVESGQVVYYCDDAKSANGTCLPSPKEWAEFLPSCDSVNFESSCSLFGPYFTCDDPEFDIRKYPYGCIGIEQTGDNNNNNNNNDGGSNSNKNSNDNDNDDNNNEDGKITVGYGDVGLYYGKGKVVIKNLDTGETLVTHDLHFGKQHDSQGDKCCVKVYPFDDSNTRNGDRLSLKVTGGGGSWTDETYTYKNNLRMSITLDEIGEDVDGYPINNNDDKKDSSDDDICNSDPESKAPSCDDLLKELEEQEKENDNNDNNDWSKGNDNDNDNNEEYDVEEEPPEEEEEDFEPQGNLSS
jgi:hypothetical protein